MKKATTWTLNNILGNIFICIYISPCIGMLQGRDLKVLKKTVKQDWIKVFYYSPRPMQISLPGQQKMLFFVTQKKESQKKKSKVLTVWDWTKLFQKVWVWMEYLTCKNCPNTLYKYGHHGREHLPRSSGNNQDTGRLWIRVSWKKNALVYFTIFLMKLINW